MTSADSCAFSTASFPCAVVTSLKAFRTGLPGYHTFLSLHLSATFIPRDSVQLLGFGLLSSRKTLYVISFRQTRDLPVVSLFPHPASFRFPSRGHPCLRLYPSHCRVDSGLAPIRNVRRQAHIKNYAPVGSFVDPPGRFFPIIRILLLRSHITHEVRLSEVSMEQIMSTFAVYCVAVTQKIYCGFVGWKNMIAQQFPSSTR